MDSERNFQPDRNLRLMDQVRQVLRYYHYRYRTEQTYCKWILRYVRHHGGKTHPKTMGKAEIESFLSHLAVRDRVSASTQRQALNAIMFLYRKVLGMDIREKIAPVKAKRRKRPPVVLTQRQVQDMLNHMHGIHKLMAQLIYGSGLRLTECIRLRIQNLDFEMHRIRVIDGKGGKDRDTVMPRLLKPALYEQVANVRKIHDQDITQGYGGVYIPAALKRKYPNASREFRWQYLFPAKKLSVDPRSHAKQRHHVLESGLQKAVKRAADGMGILKRVGCHTLRHCFATHALENGCNIRMVQKLMGHSDIRTTEVYLHVMDKSLADVESPLDRGSKLHDFSGDCTINEAGHSQRGSDPSDQSD
ncbi:MAG: integron integrase [Desulfobacteraceae bacterium]|jgi:integron integrase